MIGPGSRYSGMKPILYTNAAGETVPYLPRRAIPSEAGTPIGVYVTRAGERLDVIAARTLGNPLLFWELADTNHLLDPLTIPTSPGTMLQICMPIAKGTS